jgi:hypothetical protein
MFRFALASFCALCCALVARAADPEPTPIERKIAAQAAMASARKHLDAQAPGEAVAALEKEITNADGNKTFLNLLREAYVAELAQLDKAPNANPDYRTQVQRKLALLGGAAPQPDAPKTSAPKPPATLPEVGGGNPWVLPSEPTGAAAPVFPAPPELASTPVQPAAKPAVTDAVAQFKLGNFGTADRLFGTIGAAKLTAEQKTAWAYCRIKLAADRLNAPDCDAATAAAAVQSVSEALDLVTNNAKLLGVGREILKSARAKAGTANVTPTGGSTGPVATTGDVIETPSFRIHHGGNRALGDEVAKAVEVGREQIFKRWSGPPSGAWQPKCEIVIHSNADAYARATRKPAGLTGHATVRLTNGRATERRIDLRADDDTLITNTLPRELTHVVLADLFADPPPKWALEGMAILAGSPDEIARYARTLARCGRDGELRSMSELFELKDFPADRITGFYCQSVSVAQYLIKLNGERNFKIFLGDAQRYGATQALRRQYNIDGPQALEHAWKRTSLVPAQ